MYPRRSPTRRKDALHKLQVCRHITRMLQGETSQQYSEFPWKYTSSKNTRIVGKSKRITGESGAIIQWLTPAECETMTILLG